MAQRIPDSQIPSDFANFYDSFVKDLRTPGRYNNDFGPFEGIKPNPQDVDLECGGVRKEVISALIH